MRLGFHILGDVLAAAGSPNEYNTATFISYWQSLDFDGTFTQFFNDSNIQIMLNIRNDENRTIPGIYFGEYH